MIQMRSERGLVRFAGLASGLVATRRAKRHLGFALLCMACGRIELDPGRSGSGGHGAASDMPSAGEASQAGRAAGGRTAEGGAHGGHAAGGVVSVGGRSNPVGSGGTSAPDNTDGGTAAGGRSTQTDAGASAVSGRSSGGGSSTGTTEPLPSFGGAAGESSGGTDSGAGGSATGGGPQSGFPTFPSCTSLSARCGATGDNCCSSLFVDSSSEELMFGAGVRETPISTRSSSFYLDKYEVTVGRFQRFVAGYDAFRNSERLHEDAGQLPGIDGSGWQRAWTDALPENSGALVDRVQSCNETPFATYSDQPEDATYPMNCVSWLEAMAFCIWDGGRLPSQVEWEFAATGGALMRPYPWGDREPSSELAVFGCSDEGSHFTDCFNATIAPVGSKPAGVGRFGHLDLAGSMFEWALDGPGLGDKGPFCLNCFNIFDGLVRAIRGGAFDSAGPDLLAAKDQPRDLSGHHFDVGFRCARSSSRPIE
ncbi:MAG TPA: SUMF1/EgtB/PvdO family nonheme iron enzyme [Polyangiaceae bacterium]|nr:SUMF1/EgtB/PvdO family nonheme iron enzyme [Polyangiaceae bacterium]